MCGITGFRTLVDSHDAGRQSLIEAIGLLSHRGPDDAGTWIRNGIGMGHRRLSIVDLSQGSHQPMATPDGRYVITYNGEVFNYQELRRELEKEGWKFVTNGDTEVVLAALTKWGLKNAVRRFIGMFAIALWDDLDKRLCLIRDRLGVKPLYYHWSNRQLTFASELKALSAYPGWKPTLDLPALSEYFQFGYINAPRSIYQNVFQLRPGHWLESKLGEEPVVHRYWSVLDALENPLQGSEDDLEEQLEALMVDAFRLRMVSDVSVGMFLSGGVDSSVVTALLQKHHGNVQTFTIGFREAQFDESQHARRVAEHLRTNHTDGILEPSEAKNILTNWANLFDEPFADSSGIPTYLVSKVASKKVKVVLSADGGDELFSGYNSYASMLRLVASRDGMPALAGGLLKPALQLVPLNAMEDLVDRSPLPMLMRDKIRQRLIRRARTAKDFHVSGETSAELYEKHSSSFWRPADLSALLRFPFDRVRELSDVYPGAFAEQMCLWDLHHYLPGDILTKVDRATMAASIEGREPLLDHRLVEFAFRLPLNLRRGSLGPKHLLRKIPYKYVPREMVDRPKMGFGIPLFDWLRGDLAYLIDEYLDPADINRQGLLHAPAVNGIVAALRSGNSNATNKVWSLLAFQMWYRRWM